MPPGVFLADLNETATYAITRGAPFFLPSYIAFMLEYVNEWLRERPGNEDEVAGALADQSPKWVRPLTTRLLFRLLQAQGNRQRNYQLGLMLAPLFIRLAFTLPVQFVKSALNSAWLVLKRGARHVPPLITAVVVVFVTSDAWRILGTGFTLRFFILVSVFLVASLLFLTRRKWWKDVDVSEEEAVRLLKGIKHKQPMKFWRFMRPGFSLAPIERPDGFGAVWTYLSYLGLALFSLIVTALFVAGALILVGLILINAKQTKDLAQSVHVYWALPGHVVVTRQLLSLSFSLGAFAAFFLVAAQRADDREEYIKSILVRLRRALLVYSIYKYAHRFTPEWTDAIVKSNSPGQSAANPDHQQG